MDATQLRLSFSTILNKYGIDNLALEMELVEVARAIEVGVRHKDRAEVMAGVAKAMVSSVDNLELRMVIRATIISSLSLNPGGKDGEEFMEYAYLRGKDGENIDTFVKWWLQNFPDPKFWSFARMKTMWPQAFKKVRRDVTPKEPDKWEQEGFIPAPERNRNE